jgi:hypothetical protein
MNERIYREIPQDTAAFPEETPYAMSYVPYQQWSGTYNLQEGFSKGTMFPELNQEFLMA